MLFEFELEEEVRAYEAFAGRDVDVTRVDAEAWETEEFLDDAYFSWSAHDLLMLDHRSDYLYPFQEGYSPEKHPGSFKIDDLHAAAEEVRTSFGKADL